MWEHLNVSSIWPSCLMTVPHPVSHMWLWLEAHCGSFSCIHKQGIVATGSVSQNIRTHCMRQIHLGHFVPMLPVAIDLLLLADKLWPAGWSLAPFSAAVNCQMKHWLKPRPHWANNALLLLALYMAEASKGSGTHQEWPPTNLLKPILNRSTCMSSFAALAMSLNQV